MTLNISRMLNKTLNVFLKKMRSGKKVLKNKYVSFGIWYFLINVSYAQ